ncbi:MAG: hypothetical protein LAN83_12100 [Acidobacteriia bacterium]|nr:hypothetical protein [Terriglobia bacterium]
MVEWVLLDFLWRVALGLGAVLGLIAIVGLGIPQRKLRAIRHRVPD